MVIKLLRLFIMIISLILAISCSMSGDPSDSSDDESIGINFKVVTSQTGISTRLDIIYEDDLSGEVSYIISNKDLNISTSDQFKASGESIKTKAVTGNDGLLYDDYIAVTDDSKGTKLTAGTMYYVYIEYNTDIEVLKQTTHAATSAGRETITGYLDGEQEPNGPPDYDGDEIKDPEDSLYRYTITFPADYNTKEK